MPENKNLKVLSFSHYGDLFGANRSLLSLILALKDRIDWWIICVEAGDFTKELEKNGIKYTVIPFRLAVHSIPRKFEIIYSIVKLIRNIILAGYFTYLAVRNKIDIIHSNSSVIFIGAMTSFISGIPHIWHIREFVYKDYNLKFNFGKQFFKYWANKASRIICVSKSVQQECIINNGIVAPCSIIYNGLIHSNFEQKYRHVLPAVPTIGVVGVLDPAKNQLSAIKAIKILHSEGFNINLRLIGEFTRPEYLQELTQYIEDNNLKEQIEFSGFIKNVNSIFANLDITIMCSHYEAFGRVTIESMMNGVPVIAFDSAGSSELIDHGKTGLLYTGDEFNLAQQIKKILLDTNLYKTISINASNYVFLKFTIKKYALSFHKEIDLLLRK